MKWRNFSTFLFVVMYGFSMRFWGSVIGHTVDFQLPIGLLYLIWGIFSVIATLIIWAIWNLEYRRTEQSLSRSAKAESSLEKRKRERFDSVLRDLSDADLLRLRQRLNDGTINDDSLEEHLIGEDGELLRESR